MRIKIKDNEKDYLKFNLEAEVSKDEFKQAHDISLDFLSHQQLIKKEIPKDLINRLTHETLAYLAIEEKLAKQAYPIEISSEEIENGILLHVQGIIKPHFELKDYTLPSISKSDVSSFNANVENQLHELKIKNASYTCIDPAPIKAGDACDAAIILYENNIKIDGLTSDARRYILGQHIMPEAFDENIIGMKAGDRKTFTFTVPSYDNLGYQEEKEAKCDIYIEHVYTVTLPDINDEWVHEHYPMYESFDALKEQLLTNIESQNKQVVDSQKYSLIMQELSTRLSKTIPDEIFEMGMQDQIAFIQKEQESQGSSLQEYIESIGGEDAFNSQIMMLTKQNLSAGFILDAIFEHAQLEITQDDILRSAYTLSEAEPKITMEFYRKSGRESMLQEHAKRSKASKWLVDHAKLVD